MEKIICYNLIKPEYEKAVKEICTLQPSNIIYNLQHGFRKIFHEDYVKLLKEAGVLDLWFLPIYEENTNTKSELKKVQLIKETCKTPRGTNVYYHILVNDEKVRNSHEKDIKIATDFFESYIKQPEETSEIEVIREEFI